MYYKDDWHKAKQNLSAFWAGDDIGRPCMAVYAPRNETSESFPELHNGPWTASLEKLAKDDEKGIRDWWMDPEQNRLRMEYWFENTYFGGEAVPATYVNWGASAAAAFFGSEPSFNRSSVWYSEVIKDWDEWKWSFDEGTNVWWQSIKAIMEHLNQSAKGKYFVGMPEFGNAADNLSLMRGMDNLAVDCLEEPERIEEAIEFMEGYWVKLHEELYKLTRQTNDGGCVLPWMSLWAPGRIDQIACDFSSVLSPALFKRLFAQDIEKMGAWTDYGTYHLDGPACMHNHLDALLEIDCIRAIEFTPGAGSPPTLSPHYIPLYKKILEGGKRLYLLAQPDEVRPLCEQLPSKGLYLCTSAPTRAQADKMLQSAYSWSKK